MTPQSASSVVGSRIGKRKQLVMMILLVKCVSSPSTNLSFYDLDSDSTFTIDPDKLQWNRSNKKEGIERGWSLLGVNENGVEEPFTIPFFIEQFLDQEPPDDIEIIRNEGDEAE